MSTTEQTISTDTYLEMREIFFSLNIILETFGIVGHVLAIVVLAERTLRSSTSLYLMMMSLFNCLFLGISFYGDVDDLLSTDVTIPREVIRTIRITFAACSIYTAVAVTIERYVVVAYPLKAHVLCTVSVSWKIILSIILASVVYGSLRSLEMFAVTIDNSTDVTVNCHNIFTTSQYKFMYCTVSAVIILLILPYFIFLIFNVRIMQILYRRNRRFITGSGSGLCSHDSDVWIGVTLGITSCFLVCCTVPGIVYIIDGINANIFRNKQHVVYRMCQSLGNMNIATNFVFYCFFGKNFREIFLAKYCCCKQHGTYRPPFMTEKLKHRQVE